MSIDEMAEAAQLTTHQVYRYLRAGLIPHQKAGRRFLVHRGAFETWLLRGPSDEEQPQVERIDTRQLLSSATPVVTQLADGSISIRLEVGRIQSG